MFVTHFAYFALILFMCWTEICHGEGEEPAKNKLQGMFSAPITTNFFLFFLVPSLCTGSQEPIQKDQQYTIAKQKLAKKWRYNNVI